MTPNRAVPDEGEVVVCSLGRAVGSWEQLLLFAGIEMKRNSVQIEIRRIFFRLKLVRQIEETELPRTGLRHEYARRVDVAVHLLRIFIKKLEGFQDVRHSPHAPRNKVITMHYKNSDFLAYSAYPEGTGR